MSQKLPCNVAGCDALASRYPKVLLHAEGRDWSSCEPLILVLPMPICLDHQEAIDPQDFLLPESRRRLRIALMERGKAMPDFDDPALTWAHIGDKDWREFHALGASA